MSLKFLSGGNGTVNIRVLFKIVTYARADVELIPSRSSYVVCTVTYCMNIQRRYSVTEPCQITATTSLQTVKKCVVS